MTTIPHDPSTIRDRSEWSLRLQVPEMWAALAIMVMWLAVLFTAVFGPDIVTSDPSGNYERWPSVIPVAIFAFLATWLVAKHAFGRRRRD
jgi:hypothetical protein